MQRGKYILLIILSIALSSCGSQDTNTDSSFGRLVVDFGTQSSGGLRTLSVHDNVKSIKLVCTGSDIETPIEEIASISAGTISIDIPVGSNRTLKGTAYSGTNGTGTVLFTGQATGVRINAVEITSVTISMKKIIDPTVYPDTVVATIPVGVWPSHMAVTPDGSYVYVTNKFDNTVSVIRTSDNTVIETISVGEAPFGITITPDGSRIYVANSNIFDDTISVIRTSDNIVITTISVEWPQDVAVTPNGNYVYATSYLSNGLVSVIRTSDNAVIDTISVGKATANIAVSPDGAYVYAINDNDYTVSVIQTSDNTVTATISVGLDPYGITVTPDGSYVYVTNTPDNTMSVIRTSDNTVTTTVSVGSLLNEYFPLGIAVSPNGNYIYVVMNQSMLSPLTGSVVVMQASDYTIIDTIYTDFLSQNIALSPDGSYLYVTNWRGTNGIVSVIGVSGN